MVKLSEEFKDIGKREGQVYIALRTTLLALKEIMKEVDLGVKMHVSVDKIENEVKKQYDEAVEAVGLAVALTRFTFREAGSGQGLAGSEKKHMDHILRILKEASVARGAKEESLIRRAIVELEGTETKE